MTALEDRRFCIGSFCHSLFKPRIDGVVFGSNHIPRWFGLPCGIDADITEYFLESWFLERRTPDPALWDSNPQRTLWRLLLLKASNTRLRSE